MSLFVVGSQRAPTASTYNRPRSAGGGSGRSGQSTKTGSSVSSLELCFTLAVGILLTFLEGSKVIAVKLLKPRVPESHPVPHLSCVGSVTKHGTVYSGRMYRIVLGGGGKLLFLNLSPSPHSLELSSGVTHLGAWRRPRVDGAFYLGIVRTPGYQALNRFFEWFTLLHLLL